MNYVIVNKGAKRRNLMSLSFRFTNKLEDVWFFSSESDAKAAMNEVIKYRKHNPKFFKVSKIKKVVLE